jgi:hypothetical protein
MRKPPRSVVIAASLPFVLTGCFGVLAEPVPPPGERVSRTDDVRGVVLRTDDGAEERIEYDEVYQANWTENAIFVVGSLSQGDGVPARDVSQEYAYEDLSSVLVRKLDAGRTSILIGILAVGSIAAFSFWVNGQTNEDTVIGTPGG